MSSTDCPPCAGPGGSHTLRDAAFGYLHNAPLCMIALDPQTHRPFQANHTFERSIGPLHKFQQYPFAQAAVSDEGRERLQSALTEASKALQAVASSPVQHQHHQSQPPRISIRVPDVEILTLPDGPEGVLSTGKGDLSPVRRRYDFTVGIGRRDDVSTCAAANAVDPGVIIVFADHINKTVEREIMEAEFSDYFQNAPIALHWLSKDGIILWANKTELELLGYPRQEYIGQPISKFAHPHDQAIVREMTQQLDRDKAFHGVSVRFLAKDGNVIYLLIDSKVRYDVSGNFDHSIWFIRDDTSRRIRDVRNKILLDETKRSQTMVSNFMSRSLHHLRTPLHIMEQTSDLLLERLREGQEDTSSSSSTAEVVADSINLLNESKYYVHRAVGLIDDISDLSHLDQGSELEVNYRDLSIRELGLDILDDAPTPSSEGVDLKLVIHEGVPSSITSDRTLLRRVVTLLLEHASRYTKEGNIIFSISVGSRKTRVKFEVEHDGCMDAKDINSDHAGGKMLDEMEAAKAGTLPPIFQRYHQQLVPEEMYDSDRAESLRSKVESRMSAFHTTSLGISLSLSYHLVHALGGELRYQVTDAPESDHADSGQCNSTKLWFSVPCVPDADTSESDDEDAPTKMDFDNVIPSEPLGYEEVSKSSRLAVAVNLKKHGRRESSASITDYEDETEYETNRKRMRADSDDEGSLFERNIESKPHMVDRSAESSVASRTSNEMETAPLVLIVEDTDMCAKLVATVLRKMHIPSARARNGEEALEMLRSVPRGLYTLVLMDLRMPVMDGFEATMAIKKYLKMPVPVVALSGETKDTVKQKCDEIGFDDYVEKPMKRKRLEEIIRKYCVPPASG